MEALLTRYRNLTVLLIAFFAQLVLIAYQVRTGKDVPLLRVWTVTAVSPVEQALEFVRRNTIGVVQDYFVLVGVRTENEQLKKQMGELKLRNHYLQSELSTAERVQALSGFQAQSPSRMLAARVIGTGTGTNSQVVFIDRGSGSEVEAGMAVITPDGIVGKVIDAYPTASLVMLVTDPSFAAGVISQKNHTRGTLKGQGQLQAIVDYVQNEQKVDPGEMFYTSGDDRIFPKGFPVGKADVVKSGKTFKQIFIAPSAFQTGLEEVLVVLEGVHQPIPEMEIPSPGQKMLPPPPDAAATAGQATAGTEALSTDADRLKAVYRQAGEAQKHVFGDGNQPPPDFTKLGQQPKPAAPPTAAAAVPAPPAAPGKPAGADTGTAVAVPKPKPLDAGAAAVASKPKPTDSAAAPVVPKPNAGGVNGAAAPAVAKPNAGGVNGAAAPAVAKPNAGGVNGAAAPAAPKPNPAAANGAAAVPKPNAGIANGAAAPAVPRPNPAAANGAAAVPKPNAGIANGAAAPAVPKPNPGTANGAPAPPKPNAVANGAAAPAVLRPNPAAANGAAAVPKPNAGIANGAAAPAVPKPNPGTANAAAPGVQKPKPTAADAAAAPPKPKPRGPILVTDPSDADPELTAPPGTPKPKQQNQ